MASDAYVRYVVKGLNPYWWATYGTPFLNQRGWHSSRPQDFSFETGYGYDPCFVRTLPGRKIADEDYCLEIATVVVEFHGEPQFNSIFEPSGGRTVVDDLLAFMSIYHGSYCQWVWKEIRTRDQPFRFTMNHFIADEVGDQCWAAAEDKAIGHFQNSLVTMSTIDPIRFGLAMRWFFSALRESQTGRPLVEAALNWVCLESQANYMNFPGNKYKKVEALIASQGFLGIPRLQDMYRLRNDAFHDGVLSNVSETDAQEARRASKTLARAALLNMLGMKHSDFDTSFTKTYS